MVLKGDIKMTLIQAILAGVFMPILAIGFCVAFVLVIVGIFDFLDKNKLI